MAMQPQTANAPDTEVAHHHHTDDDAATERRLVLAVVLTAAVLLAEAGGGLLANSLALLADAGHVFTDIFALGMSWFALRQARRPADSRRTFGYHRVGIVTALLNAAALIPISAFLVYEAISRLFTPEPIEGGIMLVVAAAGLVVNVVIGLTLHSHGHGNLNIQSAVLHVAGDAVASGGVLIGALIIATTGWTPIDPLLSILISILIAASGWRLMRNTVRILLESVPSEIRTEEVVAAMRAVPGVQDVHDLHIWQIASGMYALSCHVLVDDQMLSQGSSIITTLNTLLADRFHIGHTTIQPECLNCDPNSLFCALAPTQPAHDHQH
jgi:cobalt-zinc-cadmium efflux system protein